MDALDAVCGMDESLALEVCLAVRQNKLEAAQATFEKILVVQEDKEFLALHKAGPACCFTQGARVNGLTLVRGE